MHSWYNNLPPDDPAMLEMYRCVGRALWEWSKLEVNLYDLFHELHGSPDDVSLYKKFFDISGSKLRLTALKGRLNDIGWTFRHYDFYKHVIDIMFDLADFRNDIAHGIFLGIKGENIVDLAGQRYVFDGSKPFLSTIQIERLCVYLFDLNRIVWHSFEFMLIPGQNEHLSPCKQLASLGNFSP